jgi:hypothetical protein
MMSIENGTAKDGGEDLVILMNTGSNSDDNNTELQRLLLRLGMLVLL